MGAAGAGGRHERTNGNGHWALGIHTEPRRPQHGGFGKGRGRCARESFKRQQGCSCVESGGPTRKCRVSAAHTGGCCFLLSGYPTSPACRSMVHHTQSARTIEVIYTRIVRCVCIVRQWDGIGTRYTVRDTRYRHAPSWTEQSERTPRLGSSKKAKLPCPWLPKVDTLDGARRWVSMELATTHAIAVLGSIHPPIRAIKAPRVSPSVGQNVRSAQTKWCT